jgi:hypothetical protein
MIVALGGIAFGMHKYQKDKVEKQGKDILTTIAIVTSNLKSRKIFIAVFIIYGVFFSFTLYLLTLVIDIPSLAF